MPVAIGMPASLRAASYNLHGCLGRDGRRDPERIARVVAEIRPDVIGLQEVDSRHESPGAEDQLSQLARLTTMRAIDGPTLREERGVYGNALLTRLPIVEVRRCNLSIEGYEPRGAVEALLDWSGQPIRVAVTHLGLRAKERYRQLKTLLGWLAERREPLVLVGDINEWHPFGRARRELRARLGRSRARPTFPTSRPLLALDRIYSSAEVVIDEVAVHRSELAHVASDHFPIYADVATSARVR